MQRIQKKYFIVSIILIFFFNIESSSMLEVTAQNLSPDSPIRIIKESDITRNVANLSGNGTIINPYKISNLIIDAEEYGCCIQISDIKSYLIIENCTILSSGGISGYDAGISIIRCGNITIRNCTFKLNYVGLRIHYSSSIIIQNNSFLNNENGIYSFYSHNNSINQNNISYNDQYGIFLENSDENLIKDNILIKNQKKNIKSSDSYNNTFDNNIKKKQVTLWDILLYSVICIFCLLLILKLIDVKYDQIQQMKDHFKISTWIKRKIKKKASLDAKEQRLRNSHNDKLKSLDSKKSKKFNKMLSFDSNKTEDLIQNIQIIHLEIKRMIDENHLNKAIDLLKGEIRQYKKVVELFLSLELPELSELARNKQKKIEELLYKVQDSLFLQKEQDLYNKFEKLKNSKKFDQIESILIEMKANLEFRIRIAGEFSHSNDLKKFEILKVELVNQICYNQNFIQFKNLEVKLNQIIEIVNIGELQEGLLQLKRFKSLFGEKYDHFRQLKKKDENLSELFHEMEEMKMKIEYFEQQISKQYKQLIMGDNKKQIIFDKIEASIKIPHISHANGREDLNSFLTELDHQFANWENKDGKKNR
ncbi:right-handed parallel beta-helix repeat-containing protein [Candidatus Lokiarchaeum ossiferum]|uniref:right-handed parallel beta-helix repeat-containing protein n=1 Tax=Candidatus Lokiarchaeum ossiferum TaxID=2951803 RepID=UPI00352D8908